MLESDFYPQIDSYLSFDFGLLFYYLQQRLMLWAQMPMQALLCLQVVFSSFYSPK